MQSGRNLLVALSVLYRGDWEKIYKHIADKKPISDADVHKYMDSVKSKYVTILDENFPKCFVQSFKCPFVLYYEGNLELLSREKKIGVVGSREASEYGRRKTAEITSKLVDEGFVIVSGLARGIDSTALEVANKKGQAVAFLGNSLDYYYPYENASLQASMYKKGLVMSEYPDGVKPSAENFPFRNRLIAYGSDALLVTEAYDRSGTLITVGISLGGGREIFCLPYSADAHSACNTLIKEGATMVENAEEVISNFRSKTNLEK